MTKGEKSSQMAKGPESMSEWTWDFESNLILRELGGCWEEGQEEPQHPARQSSPPGLSRTQSLAMSRPVPNPKPLPCPHNLLEVQGFLKTTALGATGVFWRPGLTEGLSSARCSFQNPRHEGKNLVLLRPQKKEHWQERHSLFTSCLGSPSQSSSADVWAARMAKREVKVNRKQGWPFANPFWTWVLGALKFFHSTLFACLKIS